MDRQPLSEEHRARIGAQRLGISTEEYLSQRARGLKWCFGCQDWRPRATAFARRIGSVDGDLNNECRDCMNPRALAKYHARADRRRAENATVTDGR